MKVYRGFSNYVPVKNAVVTTGTFDGVHIGHKTIINHINKIAADFGGETVLLTFHPHPRLVLNKDSKLQLLSTIEERIELLEKAGVDHLIIIPFDKAFSQLSSVDFIRDVLVGSVGTKKLVIGYDHHFGRNREGSFEHLIKFGSEYGFEVEEIPALDVENVNVSSTKIRGALNSGDVLLANKFLGHPYSLTGVVEHGDQIGRSIGFPTANIFVEESHKLIPKEGVYAVEVKVDHKWLFGMLNIGIRPTVSSNNQTKIEVHLFDFNEDLYNKTLKIKFIERIRTEKKFNSKEDLKKQLEQDLLYCKQILQID